MSDAYVHIAVEPGAVLRAAEEIRAIDGVETAHIVTGEYDVVAFVSLDDPDELPRLVADEIHGVTGVLDTVTNVAFET